MKTQQFMFDELDPQKEHASDLAMAEDDTSDGGHMHTTKLDLAFDALEFANGNVSDAKRIIAKCGVRISARTWHKAITARLAVLTEEQLAHDLFRVK